VIETRRYVSTVVPQMIVRSAVSSDAPVMLLTVTSMFTPRSPPGNPTGWSAVKANPSDEASTSAACGATTCVVVKLPDESK